LKENPCNPTHNKKPALIPVALAAGALGVVYGDIGTSPLYTMKEVFAGNHPIPLSPDNVLASVSNPVVAGS